jgi:hypothetical protein
VRWLVGGQVDVMEWQWGWDAGADNRFVVELEADASDVHLQHLCHLHITSRFLRHTRQRIRHRKHEKTKLTIVISPPSSLNGSSNFLKS